MSRGIFAALTGSVVRVMAIGTPSPSRRRRWTADPLVRVGIMVLLALLWPASARAQTTQVVEYYHTDALGSVRAVTNQQGQVIRRHDFMPFGEELQPTIPPAEKRLFIGKERDVETGLDYFGARYNSSSTGRFTTIDPVMTLDENRVDPQQWNRYAYVRNNPLRYTDPTGLYISGCAMVELSCADAMGKFERERQKALKNRNAEVSAAAAAHGSLGDPGVVVTPDFGGDLKGANARTTIPDAPGGDIGVLFDPQNPSLQRTVVHEGVHVGQMRAFIDSLDPVSGKYDKALNPIVVLAELSACQTGARISPYWMGGTLGSLGPKDTVKILQYLIRTPPYRQTLNQRFFGSAT